MAIGMQFEIERVERVPASVDVRFRVRCRDTQQWTTVRYTVRPNSGEVIADGRPNEEMVAAARRAAVELTSTRTGTATRYARYQARRRAELRAAGLCIQCGKAPIHRGGLCERDYEAAQAASGPRGSDPNSRGLDR